MGFRVWGVGFRGSGFRGSGFGAWGLGVWGSAQGVTKPRARRGEGGHDNGCVDDQILA